MRERVSYSKAGRAQREAFARSQRPDVRARHGLKPRDDRVLGAIFSIISTYSRVEDTVSAKQVGDIIGMAEHNVSSSFTRLHEAGVIFREGGKGGRRRRDGEGYTGLVRILSDAEAKPSPPQEGCVVTGTTETLSAGRVETLSARRDTEKLSREGQLLPQVVPVPTVPVYLARWSRSLLRVARSPSHTLAERTSTSQSPGLRRGGHRP